jgi:hypothetical protein
MNNQTTTTDKKEALKAQIREIVSSYKLTDATVKDYLSEIRKLEQELKEVERAELLNGVNAKQSKLRAAALLLWEAERPSEDITTNDGSLHKVKAKKFPKLAALDYLRLKFDNGQYIEANLNGQSFRMAKIRSYYGKPNEYKDFADFNEFLEYNNIMTAEMTRAHFDNICIELEEANKMLDEAIKNYREERTRLNISSLQHWGLMGQSALHEYKYSPIY